MLLFRSEEHIDRWCELWGQKRGGTLSLAQGWKLARAWYGSDRRETTWRRKTAQEAQELFTSLDMVGDFWNLTP